MNQKEAKRIKYKSRAAKGHIRGISEKRISRITQRRVNKNIREIREETGKREINIRKKGWEWNIT